MAKMFYSLEEAADRLKKSPDEVRDMASRNEITEFRDGDKLIFKVDQINLLAGDEDDDLAGDDSMIPLVDSAAGGSALGLEGTGLGLADSAMGSGAGQSGISVFDADELEEADPSAVTQVTAVSTEELDNVSLESFGSGSGLMDLTRESDDTSLGAEGLLDDLYSGDEGAATAVEGAADESSLFEGEAAAAGLGGEVGGPAPAAAVEYVDGKGSGLAGGLSLGVILASAGGVAVVLMAVTGAVPAVFATLLGGNMLFLAGAVLGVTLLLGGIGFFVGGRG
ncbi:MAG: hypothetical protein AAFX05_08840 [Planctomycetota bacterium]